MLKSYAVNPLQSRGRFYDEPEHALRSPFQRDRDRIIHSSAFRRLKHKTQVFVEHEGDHFRTRLTHSIEVAQVARTIADILGLDVNLAEAIALAHDLGHTPFGHTGEEALNTLMDRYGGFDHNAQAVHIVTSLERHYAQWDGLNLTWDTLEGIAKHNGPVVKSGACSPVPYALASYNQQHDLELDTFACAEAQVAALADDIAYNHHDLHDGVRAGLLDLNEVAELPILKACFSRVDAAYPNLETNRRQYEALRRFFAVLVEDVVEQSVSNLKELNPHTADDIRGAGRSVIRFSPALWQDLKTIRAYLFEHMYRAPAVVKMRKEVTQVVNDLFPYYVSNPDKLPLEWQPDVQIVDGDEQGMARLVSDYIAGMTDRFALQAHKNHFG